MARIPTLNEQQRLRPGSPVSAVNTTGVRAEGESLANLGKTIVQTANTLDRVMDANAQKIRNGEIADRMQNAAIKSQEIMNHVRINGEIDAKGNGNHKALYKEMWDKESPTFYEGLDQEGVRQLQLRLTQVDTTNQLAAGQEVIRAQGARVQDLSGNLQKKTSGIIQADPMNAFFHHEAMMNDFDQIHGGQIDPKIRENFSIASRNQSANDILHGLEQQSMGTDSTVSLRQGLGLLELSSELPSEPDTIEMSSEEARNLGISQDNKQVTIPKEDPKQLKRQELASMLNSLTSPQRAHWIESFKRQIKQKEQVKIASASKAMADFKQFALTNPDNVEEANAVIDMINSTSMADTDKARSIVAVRAYQAAGGVANDINFGHRSKMGSILNGVEGHIDGAIADAKEKMPGARIGDDFGSVLKAQMRADVTRRIQDTLKARSDNFPGFMLRHSPGASDIYRKSLDGDPKSVDAWVNFLDKQSQNLGEGAKANRIIPKADTDQMLFKFKASKNDPTLLANEISNMRSLYGEHSGRAFADLSKDDKSMAPVMFATNFTSKLASKRIIENSTKDLKDMKDVFQGFSDTSYGKFKKAVHAEIKPIMEALSQEDKQVAAAGLLDAVTREAMEQRGAPGVDSDAEAIKRAKKIIIDENFAQFNQENTYGSKLFVPIHDERGNPRSNPQKVEHFLKAVRKPENLKKLVGDNALNKAAFSHLYSLLPLEGAPTSFRGTPIRAKVDPEKEAYSRMLQLISKEGIFANTDDGHFTLKVGGVTVRGHNKQPLKLSYSDMVNDEMTDEQARTLFDDIFHFLNNTLPEANEKAKELIDKDKQGTRAVRAFGG